MQEAFTRSRLAGYVEHIDRVATHVLANDWAADDARFLFYPAMKELALDIASVVFLGHEPGTDHELVTKVVDVDVSWDRSVEHHDVTSGLSAPTTHIE